jgi:hypothetical protein
LGYFVQQWEDIYFTKEKLSELWLVHDLEVHVKVCLQNTRDFTCFMAIFIFINLLKPGGNLMYHQVQHSAILHGAHIAFMCFVQISEQTATFA